MAASGSLCVMAAHPFLLHVASTGAHAPDAAAVCRLHSKINSSSKNGALITFRQATRTRTDGRTDGKGRQGRTLSLNARTDVVPALLMLLLLLLCLLFGISFHFISFYLPHSLAAADRMPS